MTKGRREEKKIETEMARDEEGQDAKRRTGRRCAVGIASRRRKRRGGDGNRNKESRGRGGFELWKNSHFGTQKMLLLGRNDHPSLPRRERKERNVYKEGRKKKWNEEEKWRKSGEKREGGAKRQRDGIGLRVKRGESEQRHCRINIPFV